MVVGSLDIETELLVIGSGPGGYQAAIRAAQLGLEVVLVEEEKSLGGVCLNVGCIPTKALDHAAEIYHGLKTAGDMGIRVDGYSLDAGKLQDWKNGIVFRLSSGIASLLKKYGVEVITGRAVFTSDSAVRIEGKTDVSSISFKKCIIATGSSHVQIRGFEFDNEYILSSTGALALDKLPERMVIIGGGYIGTELGTTFGRLGTSVEIIEAADRIMPMIDEELVGHVLKRLPACNVKIHTATKAKSVSRKDGKVVVEAEGQDGPITLEADKLVVVVGRIPNSRDMGLENTSVKLDRKGFILIDERMRTSSENIFAIGDVTGQPMLAHRASKQAKVAAEVAAGLPSAFDSKVIPYAVYCDPEIASAGLTEEEAKEKGYDAMIGRFPFAALGRALTLNAGEGLVKVVADSVSKRILGVHIVGERASDMISEVALAIEMGSTLDDIALTIHPHPTMPEAIMEASDAALGTAIDIFMPKKGK